MINGLHMATIRELEDPLSTAVHGRVPQAKALRREPGKPLVESLIRKSQLNPTEYALAWAMTHYLAVKREDDFVGYLKTMSQIPPLDPRRPRTTWPSSGRPSARTWPGWTGPSTPG